MLTRAAQPVRQRAGVPSCWSLLHPRRGRHGSRVDDGRQIVGLSGLSVVVGIVHAAIKPSEAGVM